MWAVARPVTRLVAPGPEVAMTDADFAGGARKTVCHVRCALLVARQHDADRNRRARQRAAGTHRREFRRSGSPLRATGNRRESALPSIRFCGLAWRFRRLLLGFDSWSFHSFVGPWARRLFQHRAFVARRTHAGHSDRKIRRGSNPAPAIATQRMRNSESVRRTSDAAAGDVQLDPVAVLDYREWPGRRRFRSDRADKKSDRVSGKASIGQTGTVLFNPRLPSRAPAARSLGSPGAAARTLSAHDHDERVLGRLPSLNARAASSRFQTQRRSPSPNSPQWLA